MLSVVSSPPTRWSGVATGASSNSSGSVRVPSVKTEASEAGELVDDLLAADRVDDARADQRAVPIEDLLIGRARAVKREAEDRAVGAPARVREDPIVQHAMREVDRIGSRATPVAEVGCAQRRAGEVALEIEAVGAAVASDGDLLDVGELVADGPVDGQENLRAARIGIAGMGRVIGGNSPDHIGLVVPGAADMQRVEAGAAVDDVAALPDRVADLVVAAAGINGIIAARAVEIVVSIGAVHQIVIRRADRGGLVAGKTAVRAGQAVARADVMDVHRAGGINQHQLDALRSRTRERQAAAEQREMRVAAEAAADAGDQRVWPATSSDISCVMPPTSAKK